MAAFPSTIEGNPACADRMLEAALEVFREKGYGASIDDVARRAKVARQTIYNHFGSKQALFEAALEHAIVGLFAGLKTGGDGLRERLIRFGIELRARTLNPASIKLQRALLGEAPRFPELAKSYFDRCIVGSCTQMAGVFEQAMCAGRMRKDDPVETARLFMEMLVGFDRWRMLFGGTAPESGKEEVYVTRVVDFFMQSYAVESSVQTVKRS